MGRGILVAVAAVVVATLLRMALTPVLGLNLPYATYFAAVGVAAWFGGVHGGVAAVVLGLVTAAWFFVPPANSFWITDAGDQLGLALFLLGGSLITALSEMQHRTTRRAVANEAALQVSEARLETTLRSIGDAVIATDRKGSVTFMNPIAEGLTGWTLADALGKPMQEVFRIVHEGSREEAESPVDRVLRDGVLVGLANHTLLLARDGREVSIDDSAAPIRADGEEIGGVVLVFREVTERRRLEAAGRVRAAVGALLGSQLDREGLLTAMAAAPVPDLAEWCVVDVLEPEGGLRRVSAVHRDPGRAELLHELARSYPIHLGDAAHPIAQVFASGKAQRGGDVPEAMLTAIARDERHLELLQALGFRSYMAAPLTAEGRVFAVLACATSDRAYAYSAEDLALLQELADRAAAAVEQRRLFDEATAARRNLAFIAEASALLASSLDYETTLKNVARLSVPHLADWCQIHLLEDDGSVRRIALAHADPAKLAWLESLPQRDLDPNAPRGLTRVLKTREAELYPDIPDSLLEEAARDEEDLRVLRETRPRSAMIVPMVAQDRVLGGISLITSESGRHYDEADLELAEDLAHRAAMAIASARLYGALREADRRKDEFLAMLAHELRNPLAPMTNSLELLRLHEAGDARLRRQREILQRQVRQLVRLTDDLLDVSRITRGKIAVRHEAMDLAALVRATVEDHRDLLERAKLSVSLCIDAEPLWIEGDEARLSQALGNLLQNAAKFGGQRGSVQVRLHIEAAASSEPEAVISVRDSGIGIAPELLPHVFDVFTQADRSLDRTQGGLGLGLALVEGLVELHGGRVQAASEGLGRGAEFSLRLPLLQQGVAAEPGGAAPPVVEAAESADAAPTRGPEAPARRVLIVEDNRDAAETLREVLELCHADVEVVYDGYSALEVFLEFRPDLVICDIGLPGIDGYEVARRLRAMGAQDFRSSGVQGSAPGSLPAAHGEARIPEDLNTPRLVALTGYAQEEDRRRALEAGFDEHLPKPADPAQLHRLLRHGPPS
jgi:PAS domain S-box-containing protein